MVSHPPLRAIVISTRLILSVQEPTSQFKSYSSSQFFSSLCSKHSFASSRAFLNMSLSRCCGCWDLYKCIIFEHVSSSCRNLLCSRAQSALLCTQHVCWSIQGTRNRHFFYEDLYVCISNPELPFPSNTGLNASRSLLGSSVIRICLTLQLCLPSLASLSKSELIRRQKVTFFKVSYSSTYHSAEVNESPYYLQSL